MTTVDLIAKFGATRNIDSVTSIHADQIGNIYLIGGTSGVLNGEQSDKTDIFIIKYNTLGQIQWTNLIDSGGYDSAIDTELDDKGAFWILNMYNTPTNGFAVYKFTKDEVLSKIKFDSLGIGKAVPQTIALHKESYYLAGYINDGIGYFDSYVDKYSENGNLLWRKIFASNTYGGYKGREEISFTRIDSYGNICAAGRTSGSFDSYKNKGDFDIFILKYSQSGDEIYRQFLGGSGNEDVRDMQIADDGSFFITGITSSEKIFEVSSESGTSFIAKFTPNGTFEWIKFLGYSNKDSSFDSRNIYPTALMIGQDNLIHVTGSYGEKNERGSFLYSYTESGEKLIESYFGLSGNRFHEGLHAKSITNTEVGNLLIAGTTIMPEANGEVDIFFASATYTPTPTYTVTPSTATINEGEVLTSTVTTTILATGSKLYYSLSGTGITTTDFSAGALTGEGTTDATSKFTFTHTLANDLATEGAETLSIKLYTDSARTLQVGDTATVSIVDSSTTPAPTYTVTPSATTINEGAVLTSTVTTTNVATGTKLYYALSGTGITTADFSAGALTGEGITDSSGKFSFSHTLANDLTTEGAEALSIKLYSDNARTQQVRSAATVSVVDSSNNLQNIDLSKGEVDLILNIKILADSGFSYSDLSFSLINPPSNLGYYANPSVHIDSSDRVTGSTKDGTYSSIVKVGSNALPGTYSISSFSIKDSIGNQLQKSGPDLDKYLASIGINKEALTFSVIGTAPANTDSAEPKLSSATFSSKVIDLSKGETDLLLNTTITDASSFNYSYLSFSLVNPPSDVSVINPFANISTWDKISGSNKDGSYSKIVNVGSNALPGTYAISSLSIADTIGNSINKYGPDLDKYLASIGINKEALTFSVIGTAPANTDSTEPKISSAMLSSKAIDLSKGETDLLLNTTITDASGFSHLSLRYSLLKADGSIDLTNPKYIIVSLWDKISGTINNGSYSTIITLGADFATGTYVVDNLSIEDRGGISISKSSKKDVDAYLGSLGIDPASLSFAVTGEPPKPVVLSPPIPSNPVLTKSSALNSIDQKTFNAGDLIAIEIDFSDIIGLDDGIVGNLFIHPANSLNPFSNSWNHTLSTSDISNGSSKEGTIRKTFEIPSNATAGEWYVSYLNLSDKNGNQKTSFLRQSYPVTSFPSVNQFEVFSSQIGVPSSSLKFTVANNKMIDTKSPIIKAIRFDSHEIILGDNGAYFKIEIDFLDESGLNGFSVDESLHSSDEYGIGWLSIAPTSPSFQLNGLQLTKTDLIKGTAYEGTLSKDIYIPKSAQPGEWHITAILLGDANGNEDNFYLSGDTEYHKQIFASKIGISIDDLKFKIIKNNSADVDYEPPVIRAIRFGSDEVTIGSSGSQQLFEFDYSDLSGIGSLYSSNASSNPRVGFVQIQSPSGEHGIYLDLYKDDISKGDIYNGTIRKQIDLPANSPPGTWSLYTIELNDKSGQVKSEQMRFSGPNQNLPTSSQIEHLASRLGLSSSSIQFNVINSNILGSDNSDNDAPSIKAIRFLSDTSLQTTYTLTPSATTLNEGAVLTSTVITTNVATGTKFYYALSGTGITTADFSAGALTGEGITDATGKFTFTHTLANDLTKEGAESLNIKLFTDSSLSTQVGSTASVSIADTSVNPFNLDIDGDGKVTALGDGLMVIRKLFGFAFAGDALTNKAISPTATRTTAEIHQFIESGISTGMLDVDKDGKTTALGDGLMVIRHLFGAAFAGAALTNKAISPDSPYFGTPVDHLTIANAIDSMKVIPALST